MDILIKSFNRPFFLDRCIQSIYNNVLGDFQIKVLDDGTPEKYLEKIQQKYPDILIFKSSQYQHKIQSIAENIQTGKNIDGFSIPTDLWKQAVTDASDYFLITEDDVWFTGKINLSEIGKSMKENKIHLTKLGWLGNHRENKNIETKRLDANIHSTYHKNLFTSNAFVMDIFFYNRYKFFSLLYKLRWVNHDTKRKYWHLTSIMMGIHRKDYWLHTWKGLDKKVDETRQLLNASTWFHKNKTNRNLIARTREEFLRTTFSSSATNSYHKYGNGLDVDRLNHILNEYWFNEKLNSMENYPQDFSEDYISAILDQENHPKATSLEWKKWVEKFKQQYRNLGAQVD